MMAVKVWHRMLLPSARSCFSFSKVIARGKISVPDAYVA